MNRILVLGSAILFSFGATAAHADSIVFGGTMDVSGFGFGNDPRALTIQSHGPSQTSESGCIAPGLTAGSGACAAGDGSTGGDEPSPLGFPKQAAPTVSSLGIKSGSSLGILFDGVQPQGGKDPNGTLTINGLTLKLYNGTSLLYDVSLAPVPLTLATNPGNGNSDYLFTLDPSAIASFNTFLNSGLYSNLSVALDSTISFPNQSAGPDSYTLINLAAPSPTPEPSSLLLLGSGIAGAAGLIRRRLGLRLQSAA